MNTEGLWFYFLVRLVIVMILIGWIPALIARSKGRDFGLWWVYGGALFIIALVHAILLSSKEEFAKKIERQRREAFAAKRRDAEDRGLPLRLSCWTCIAFEPTSSADRTRGFCRKHGRKTFAYGVCEGHTPTE